MTPDETRDRVESVLREVSLAHQRIPLFDGTNGQRCTGCDHLRGAPDGPNSPQHAAHVASVQAAALGEVLADVWDAGGSAAAENQARFMYDDGPQITNPYRAEGGDRG